MTPRFWKDRWRKGKTGFHGTTVNAKLAEHWAPLALERDAVVFVPLCGKSVDMLWLAEQGHHVVGVEVSPIAVEAFFKENGLEPEIAREPPFERWSAGRITIFLGDFFALTPDIIGPLDALYDRASFIALPEEMRLDYARHIAALLSSHARGLLMTIEYDQEEMEGPPFSVDDEEVRRLFGEAFTIELIDDEDVLERDKRFAERGVTALRERFYRLNRRD